MTPAEYDEYVWSKIDPKIMQRGPVAILDWAILKLNSEAGELAGLLSRRDYHERDVDEKEFCFEDGDCQFYVSVIALVLGYSTQTIMEMNVAKLNDRGDYANYLQQKMEAEKPENPYADVIADLERTLRRYYDLAGKDSGEIDPAESSP